VTTGHLAVIVEERGEIENAAICGAQFGFPFEESSARKSDYRDVIVFESLRFQNVFCPHQNTRRRCQILPV